MLLEGRKKVHITAVGVEVNRVIEPILKIGADSVIIISNTTEGPTYRPFVDAVISKLRKSIREDSVTETRMDLFDIEKLIGQLGKLIADERSKKNTVFINVSVGSRLYDAAGIIAASMFGAIAYYAEVKDYWQKISIYYKKGIPVGTVKIIGDIIEIPQFHINPPKKDWIIFLNIIKNQIESGGITSQLTIAKKLQEIGLISACREETRSENIRILVELRRRYISPILKEGWIEIEGQRRSARLKLTEPGKRMLNVFSPIYL
jgi:hypothetical protein